MLALRYKSEITWKIKRVSDEITKIWSDVKDEESFDLEDIVRLIEWAYRENEAIDIVIDGKKGSGTM